MQQIHLRYKENRTDLLSILATCSVDFLIILLFVFIFRFMILITISIDFRWNECKSRLLGLFNFKISSRHISWSLYLFKKVTYFILFGAWFLLVIADWLWSYVNNHPNHVMHENNKGVGWVEIDISHIMRPHSFFNCMWKLSFSTKFDFNLSIMFWKKVLMHIYFSII